MIAAIKDILGLSSSEYDLFIIIICTWIIIYFLYLIFNLVTGVINRV